MSKNHKIKALAVVWDDAFDGPGGWVDPTRYRPHIVDPITIGWFVEWDDAEENPDPYLTLYSSYYYDDDGDLICSNPMHIPRGMIRRITRIKTKKIGDQ